MAPSYAAIPSWPEMAPISNYHQLARRDLSVNGTQKATLGVIAAYVVVIALLWNLPYVRWSLWPFKVSSLNGQIHCCHLPNNL